MYLLRLALASLANRRFTAFLTAFAIALSVCLLLAVERVRTEAAPVSPAPSAAPT
jgi:hypothetical protein